MGNVGPRSVRGWPEREVRPGHRDPAQRSEDLPWRQKAGDADSPPPSRSYASLPRAIRFDRIELRGKDPSHQIPKLLQRLSPSQGQEDRMLD